MLKKFTLLVLSFLLTTTVVMAQTSLEGRIVTEDGEGALLATIALYKNGVLIVGSETDFDGYYAITNLDPGTYDVEARYTGFTPKRINGVVINANQANYLDDIILSSGVLLDLDIEVVDYKVPLIKKDETSTSTIVSAEKIRNLPVKDINSIAAQAAGIASQDGGEVNIRGARSNQTNYYLDGVRVNGRLPPQTEIEQLQVLTAGISAKYGDVTGGLISITTKGPSDQFSGYLEAETSEFLDNYGFTLANLSFSGPIIRMRDRADSTQKKTVLGFRAALQYNYQKDQDPSAVDIYRATEETIDQLSANPITSRNGAPVPTAELLGTGDGVEIWDYQPNNDQTDMDALIKLDARLSDAIDISLTGTYNSARDRFAPDPRGTDGRLAEFRGIGAWDVFNWVNNPVEDREVYRGVLRFRHRIGANTAVAAEDDGANNSIVQNLSYYIQAGFERRF